jgi:hypothetical protein
MPRIMKLLFGVLLIILSLLGLMAMMSLPACVPFLFTLYLSLVFCVGIIAGIFVCHRVFNNKTF